MMSELGKRVLGRPITGQGLRFILSGGFVALVYTGTTLLLSDVVGVPFEAALVTGYTVGLATHFTLQRLFVWSHAEGFALPLQHQVWRYLLLAAAQYGATAAATGTLPHALGVPTEAVYLTAVAVLAVTNFLFFRTRVFHAAAPDLPAPIVAAFPAAVGEPRPPATRAKPSPAADLPA